MSFVYKYQTVDANGSYVWAAKSFKTQKELFRYLVDEKEEVLAQKKSIIKRAEGTLSLLLPVTETNEITKGIKPLYENDKEAGILKRTVVANTYWWMDSHSDVHLGRGDDENGKAIFTNTIKGRVNKIFPIDQHNYSLDGKMGKTLNLYEAPISWRSLGVGRTGMTEALFAEMQIEKDRNEARYKDYLNDEIDQHSVGMRYLDIQLAVNDEEYDPKGFQLFNKYISKIGNRQAVEAQGYYFPVAEAYLGEYSAVIEGSNPLTPTLSPSGDASKHEPSGDTQLLDGINKLIFNIKLNDLCQK